MKLIMIETNEQRAIRTRKDLKLGIECGLLIIGIIMMLMAFAWVAV